MTATAKEVYASMTDNERLAVTFGMFPGWIEKEGFSQDEAVKLIKIATEKHRKKVERAIKSPTEKGLADLRAYVRKVKREVKS